MIVLDTNVISEILRPLPDARVVAWLESITDGVAITAITLAELLAGLRCLPAGARRSALAKGVEAALEPYRNGRSILAFDDKSAEKYADVLVAREKAGLPISTPDAQIAAICLAYRASCATPNAKDFAHTGVRVVDPWSASRRR